MLILCGLTGFWLLASPMVPYTFDVGSSGGMVAFVLLQILITVALGVVGVTLNRLADEGARVTPATVRMALRRGRRR